MREPAERRQHGDGSRTRAVTRRPLHCRVALKASGPASYFAMPALSMVRRSLPVSSHAPRSPALPYCLRFSQAQSQRGKSAVLPVSGARQNRFTRRSRHYWPGWRAVACGRRPRKERQDMTAAKIRSTHCERTAYVYVRQSTPLQVMENRESTERQYHLRDRAIELGWPPSRVEVIDEDQGRSGSSAEHRAGFQRLV